MRALTLALAATVLILATLHATPSHPPCFTDTECETMYGGQVGDDWPTSPVED